MRKSSNASAVAPAERRVVVAPDVGLHVVISADPTGATLWQELAR